MKIIKRLGLVLVFIAVYFVVGILVSNIGVTVFGLTDYFMLDSIVLFIVISILVWFSHKYQLMTFNIKTLTKTNVMESIAVFFVMNALWKYLINFLPQVPIKNQESLEAMFDMTQPWGAFIAIVILGPILEELFFRAVLIRFLFQEKMWLGLIVSTSLFSLLHHVSTLTEFIIYGYMGLVFGVIYMKTKSLECSILVHTLNNLISFAFMIGWIK